jgi:hypothetical protein
MYGYERQSPMARVALGGSNRVSVVMSAASIGAAKGGGYARYLEGKTVEPERGDYYLTLDGEPVQAPGRWLMSQGTRERLGIDGRVVDGPDFVAAKWWRSGRGSWSRRSIGTRPRGG